MLVLAQEEARFLDHSFIGSEHILLGLVRESDGPAAKALASLGITAEAIRAQVVETIGPASGRSVGSPPFTPRAKKVLELSLREALQLGHNYVGTEHLLLGLVREGEGVGATVLTALGADLPRVREAVISMLAGGGSQESISRPRAQGPGWREYPTGLVAGPPSRLRSEGLEFSIVGLQLYEEAVDVLWQLSGIPKPIADLMQHLPGTPQAARLAHIALSDDRETDYSIESAGAALRRDDELAGHTRFTPAIPATTRVKVTWQDQTIDIDV